MGVQPLTSFNSGELSPLMLGRTDLPAYNSGLRRGLNCIVVPHGPAYRRTGTRRAGRGAGTAKKTISWIFGVGDAYTVEVSDLRMRFWRSNGVQVVDGGGAIVELVTPWTADQARELRWHQSGDVLRFTHPSVPTQDLKRTVLGPPETFTLTPSEYVDGPYYSLNASTTTFTASGTGTGSLGVTASAVTGINNDTGFQATDVGRHLRLGDAWGKITAVGGTTGVTVNFETAVASTSPTTTWRLGLYSDTTGWPSCICIHQQRTALGSNPAYTFPRVDLSKTGAIARLVFTPGTDDDLAIQGVIDADELPVIRDVRSGRVLVIITGAGASRMGSTTSSPTLTPLGSEVTPLPTTTGGGNVRALAAQGSILYLDLQCMSVGEIRPKSEIYADALGYREVSIRNEHLLRDSPGTGLAWADKPWGLMLVPREDGVLLMGPYQPEQDVIALTPHQLAGGGKVLSVNTLPTTQGNAIWLLVDRDGDISLEVLTDQLRGTDPDREAVNLDMAVTVRDDRATTLTDMGDGLWRAGSGVFTAADENRAIRVLELAGNDALNMPTWRACTLRIDTVESATDIRCTVEGTAPQSPVASGEWLVSLSAVTGLDHLDGFTDQAKAWVDGSTRGPFTVTGGTLPANVIGVEEDVWVVTVGLFYRSELQPMPPNPPTAKGSAVGRPTQNVRPRLRVVRTEGLAQVNFKGDLVGLRPLRRGTLPMGMPPPLYSGDMVMEGGPEADTPVAPFFVSESAGPFCVTSIAANYSIGETG